MKKIILLSVFLFFGILNSQSQKILFDCSTGESASNADWVIDADIHNLNSDWPTTTGGSESNPQQIPTPAQSGISGSTSETFWNGALSAWGVECVKYNSGWTIETLTYNGLITYGDGSNPQDLSNYKVFVLDEPNSLFSASEKTAIVNFVNAGGGLFLISDHDVADRNGDGDDAVDAINDLLTSSGGFNNGLGMTLDYANFTDAPTTNVIASGGGDPLIDGTYGPITAMEFHGATSMTINISNNSTVKGVVYKTGATLGGTTGVMAAYCTYGSSNGRVVLITDSSPADDGTGDSGDSLYDGWDQQSGDNGNIHMNATIWLMGAGTTTPTLTVSPTTLTGYTYVVGGGPSSSQTFTLSGSNLDGTQVTVTGSTNYEVSLDNTTFGASVNVSYTAPTLSNTTIYVRLKAGLAVGTYNSETITCSDNGTAADKTVSNDGSVTSGAAGCAIDLIISQVNENGSDKYVEIANFTGASISLVDYDLVIYANGAAAPTSTIDLTDGSSIADGDVWILANANVSITADQVSGSFAPNGNDVIALRKTSSNIDVFGTIGNSTYWYDNQQYIRNSSITTPTITYAAGDWTISVYGGGDPGTLGTHTMDCGSSNDADSEVSASATLTEPATISSTVTAANGIQVFDFTFTDLGTADGLATIIDQIQITPGSANAVADWTTAIAGAVLNGPDQTNMVGTVNATNITFASSGMISIADGANETYTLSIWLNSDLSGISDNDVLEFAMDYTNITSDVLGSSFGIGAPESGDANVAIDIAATQLYFVQQPINTNINQAMTPDPTVKAGDVNGNIDVDYSVPITVTSSGTMTGDPVSGTWASGVAIFTGLTHTVAGTGLTLTASDGNLTDRVSTTFDIIEPSITLADNGTQIAAADVAQGTTKHTLHSFTLTVTDAATELSQVDFTSAGSYIAADIDKFQLWYYTADDLGAATQLGSDITTSLGGGSHSFTSLGQSLPVDVYYFWITTDIDAAGTVGNTINSNAVATSGLTFTSGSESGSTTAGGAQTIIAYVAPSIFISEIASDGNNGNWQDEYVEISNNGATGADLTGWYLEYYNDADVIEGGAVALTGTLAAGDAWVIAARTSGYITITPDFNGNFPMNSNCYVKLKDNTSTIIDEAGTATSDEFNQNNFEFINCSGDNLPVANWVDHGTTANGTPGVVNCGAGNDTNSDVDGPNLLGQPNPATIPSTIDTDPEAIQVFDFDIYDYGTTDGVATDVTQITIKAGTNNTADWSVVLQNAKISLDGGTTFVTTGTPTITASTIVFPITAGNLVVADGTAETVSLFTYLNTSGIVDNEVLEFMVDGTAHGFTADATGSQFAGTFTGTTPSPVSNQITITVTATALSYSQQPTNTVVNIAMSPDPTVSAVDVNGNVDVDYATAISVSSDGTMTGDPVSGTWLNGVATFASLTHTVIQAGRTLTASSGAFTPVASSLFDITDVPLNCASDLIISEYVEGSGNNKFIEIYNDTGADVDLSNYDLVQYNNGGGTVSFTLTLAGTLIAGNTLVIENSSEVLGVSADLSTSNSVMTFNGNDAVALRKAGTVIDIVGDPNSATNFAVDVTLVRKNTVFAGAIIYDATEWDSYAQDDVSHLGSHSMVCTCNEPTTHASALSFSSVSANSMTLAWTNGDGVNRIVVAREANAVNWTPTDNNTYAANSSFGSGTQLGTGNYVVYNGSSNTVNVTNLTPGTTYYFKIFEYGCQAGSEDYLTSGTPAEGNETTLPNDVTNFQVDCKTATTANLSWTLPAGSYDGIMIAALPNATPDNPTCAGNTLISPNTDFSAANVYCGNVSGAVYVYNNVGTNVTITGLTSGTSYHFKAFTYKNDAWSSGNEIIQTAEVSDVSDFYSTCGNGESLLSWTNPAATCFDEVIIAVNTSSVTGIPSGTYTANSLDYTDGANPTLSDGSVIVYNGTTSPQTVTGLTNGTTYFFKVFVRSGTDWSTGVEVSCAATTASFFDYGDLAIVGINTNYTNIPNDYSDEIQFVCFKDITTETSIDFTDNGYERLYPEKWGDSEGTITLTRTGADVPAGTVITVRGRNAASNWHVFIGSGTPNGSLTNDDANWTITDGGVGNNVFDLNVNDQIWMMQGGVWNNPSGLQNATYSGKVLYGWTAIGWEPVPGYDDTKGSTIFLSSACSVSNLVGVANEDKVRYDSTITAATQRDWISRFNDEQQWTGYADSTTYQNGGTLPDIITISAAGFAGVYKWTGETSSDWDDCTNWLNLKVPDATADVQFVSDDCSNDLVILPGQTVICKSLEITGSTLNHSIKAEGDATAVIEVHGDLTIGGPAGVLDFDDGTSAADGTLKVYGDWYENTDGGFLEGNSSVEFIGSVSQSINTVSSEAGFYNLKIDNSSASGVALANVALVTGTLNLAGGILNLNGSDLTISGSIAGTNGVFAGHQWSNLTVNGTGAISYNFSFASPQQLSRFNMNRTGEIAVIGTNLTVDDLQIDAGSVELSAGKYYTVNNSITNTPGTNGLVLKSDATGTASLIQPSSSIQATCERYMTGGKWNFFFTPLDNVATSIFNSGNPNFYYYDETPADYWDATTIYGTTGWKAESTGTLSTNKGYIQYYNSAKTYNLTGGTLYDPAAGSKIFTLSSTDSGSGSVNQNGVTADWNDFEGWNFIGNPFTSAFDWNQINFSNVENVVYYYDGSNYKYYGGGTSYNQGITVNGGSQFIPANQGVFVKAVVNNGTVTVPLAARTHNAQSFWKKNQNIPDNLLKLSIENNGFTDETVIRTLSEATEEHDAKYDAYKLFSYDKSKPMLYSRNDDNSHIYAINSVPNFRNEKIILLGMYIGTESYYTISLTENSFNKMHIYLEDNLLNETVNLIVHSSYSFYQQPTDFSDRFKIRFKLNSKPELTGNIPDQIIDVNKIYSYTVPNTIFNEKDEGDSLNYSVSLDNGNDLPEWLIFDSETRTFTGKPEETGDLNIKVTVKDIFGASVSDIYKLTVTTESFVQNISDDGVSVYPNPTDGKFRIEFMKPVKGIISIIDLSGKVLRIKSIHSNLTNIDLRKFGEGVYIVDIKTDNQIIKKRIIIK